MSGCVARISGSIVKTFARNGQDGSQALLLLTCFTLGRTSDMQALECWEVRSLGHWEFLFQVEQLLGSPSSWQYSKGGGKRPLTREGAWQEILPTPEIMAAVYRSGT